MKKSYIKLIVLLEIVGVIMQGLAIYDAYSQDTTTIDRPAALEPDDEVSLSVEGNGQKADIDLKVLSQRPAEDEVEALFEKAEAEIDETFLGDNTSADAVWRRLNIRTDYADGLVEAEWDFSPSGIVDPSGNIDYREYEDREVITANCTLRAFEKEHIYSFGFVTVKPDISTPDGFLESVRSQLLAKNDDNSEDKLVLPREIAGAKLEWSKPVDHRGALICLMGLLAGAALSVGTRADEKKDKDKLREQYGRQYPDVVENLCLYVGAGISVRGAFEKMEASYIKWKDAHPKEEKEAYENLILMNRAIRDGRLEGDAYESFGRDCMHPSYRKLAILLRQNLKRGNEKLLEQLSHEEQLVLEMRRREIKSAGEVISTKLLIPMGGLLLMILIMLIFPAIQSVTL